jgi:hypothetical protein
VVAVVEVFMEPQIRARHLFWQVRPTSFSVAGNGTVAGGRPDGLP